MLKNNISVPLIERINKVGNENASILQKLILPADNNNCTIYMKREDLIHPTISGNKWRKLKYNLVEASDLGFKTLLTFGGAYSNHIHALSSASKIFGFNSIGIIRGEPHLPLNPTLSYANKNGMDLHYIDRQKYRKKTEEIFINELHQLFGDFYLIPEGGTNKLAVKGCAEVIDQIKIDFDYIATACGTGGTVSGLICGLEGKQNVIGIPVLKGAEFLREDIVNLTKAYSNQNYTNWSLNLNYHFGGYAKITEELILFMNEFENTNDIKLDPIYTAKLLFGINSMILNSEIPKGSTIIVIHSGGLQGISGMQKRIDKLLS
jgi:1-aminocyclopropane-1-carboxylate deaminase/D-cysteine desulfhydrase-like pyridoxal-dependent ACC family enzyme